MTVAPDEKKYGEASLQVQNKTLGGTRNVTVTAQGGAFPGANLAHDEETLTVDISEFTSGASPPSGEWHVAAVEDNEDVNGDYRPANVLDVVWLGTGGSLASTRELTVPKHGFFRLVVMVGDGQQESNNIGFVDTGGLSSEYHYDSDGNEEEGGSSNVANIGTLRDGYVWRHTVLESCSYSVAGDLGYGQTHTITLGLKTESYINPKAVKVAYRTAASDGDGQDGVYRPTPDASGEATTVSIQVDEDFELGETDYHVHVGVNDVLDDAGGDTPAGEVSDFLGSGSIVGTTAAQRAWIIFDTSGHLSGWSAPSNNRVRSNAGDKTIASGISIHKASTLDDPGVNVFGDSARTEVQDLFRRTLPVSTEHAQVFLQAWVADAYGNALASTDVRAKILSEDGTDTEDDDNTSLTTDANGLIEWDYTVATGDAAFNRFVQDGESRATGSHASTGPDDPDAPPATFANANKSGSDATGEYRDPLGGATALSYDGPYPAYAKKVQVLGRVYGSKEPSDDAASVFGVNSEEIFEDIWTGEVADATIDVNDAPDGSSTRTKNLGTGSLRFKVCTEIDEASTFLEDAGEHNPKDVAGRLIPLANASDHNLGRFAAWNATDGSQELAPTDDSPDADYKLEGSLGYNDGDGSDNGFQSLPAPTDPALVVLYYAYAPDSTQRSSFDLPTGGNTPGFTADDGMFGYVQQSANFVNLDPAQVVFPTVDLLNHPSGATQAIITAQFARLTNTGAVVPTAPDEAGTVYVHRHDAEGEAVVAVVSGDKMTPLDPDGDGKSANHQYLLDIETDATYTVTITGFIDGSRYTAPGQLHFSVGGIASQGGVASGSGSVGEQYAVQTGDAVTAEGWEEAIAPRDITTKTLAEAYADGLLEEHQERQTVKVVDRRPPETFEPGDSYTIDNHGRGLDGEYTVQRVERDASTGHAILTVGRILHDFFEDRRELDERVGATERF